MLAQAQKERAEPLFDNRTKVTFLAQPWFLLLVSYNVCFELLICEADCGGGGGGSGGGGGTGRLPNLLVGPSQAQVRDKEEE